MQEIKDKGFPYRSYSLKIGLFTFLSIDKSVQGSMETTKWAIRPFDLGIAHNKVLPPG